MPTIKMKRSLADTVTRVFVWFVCIACVAGVILPFYVVYQMDKQSTRKRTCQSNLKELGNAVTMYCNDYNGLLPSSKLYAGSKKWNAKDFIGYAKSSHTDAKNTVRVVLSKYINNKDVFWCPSDPNFKNVDAPVSYYWKAAVDAAWYQGDRNLADFEYAADQVLLYEHNGWHWGDQSKGLTGGVSSNTVFMDGHVATKRIKNSGYTIDENPPEPLPRSGVGEPAWFNCSDEPNSKPKTGEFFDPKHYYDDLY